MHHTGSKITSSNKWWNFRGETSALPFNQWSRYTHIPFLNILHKISYTVSCPKITSNISHNIICPKYKYVMISQYSPQVGAWRTWMPNVWSKNEYCCGPKALVKIPTSCSLVRTNLEWISPWTIASQAKW